MKKKNAAQTTASDLLGAASNEELLRRERQANSAWSKLRRNKTAMVGLIIVCVMVFIAVFAPCCWRRMTLLPLIRWALF